MWVCFQDGLCCRVGCCWNLYEHMDHEILKRKTWWDWNEKEEGDSGVLLQGSSDSRLRAGCQNCSSVILRPGDWPALASSVSKPHVQHTSHWSHLGPY